MQLVNYPNKKMMYRELVNKLLAVVFFIFLLRLVNHLSENLLAQYGFDHNRQSLGMFFQIFISGVSAFFVIFSPPRYKFYYFLPAAFFAFYGVLLLLSIFMGDDGAMIYSLIY